MYPLRRRADGPLKTVDSLEIAGHLVKLYGYLVDRGCITQLDNFREECLSIFSRDVLARIQGGDASWEAMVPEGVAQMIKSKGMFGFESDRGHPDVVRLASTRR